jgi:creatinine amidohydrolase
MRALAELTRDEVAAAAGNDAVLLLPFGAVEQHGPNLPFGTDALVVDAVARAAAERVATAGVVVAPTFAYGASDHHLDVGGALSLRWETFAECVSDLLRAAAGSGFRRAFVLNGHGGNDQPLQTAARAAARDHGLEVGGGSYWRLAADRLTDTDAPVVPGHAGRFEAALVLAVGGGVTTDAAPARPKPAAESGPYWYERPDRWTEIDGFTDDPGGATAAEGARYLELVVAAVSGCIDDFAQRSRRIRSP